MFGNKNPSQKRRAQPSLLAYIAYLSHIPSRNIIIPLLHEKKGPCSSQSNSAVDNNTEADRPQFRYVRM